MISNSYESITFEVEKGLKKPENFYMKSDVKNIFSGLFKRGKQVDEFELRRKYLNSREFLRELQSINEELEILYYNLDTEKDEFFNAKKNR